MLLFLLTLLLKQHLTFRILLKKYGYNEAVIFGHALQGNLHFVFTQDFNTQKEIDRYAQLMSEVSQLVVHKYDGSLKAEHGTGRNMAPYVEMEWGKDAYNLMKEIKRIFDPSDILNPGVILNSDKSIHIKNLKPIPAANEIIDKCTECGFCEPSCVSSGLTLTPRQRIVIHREIVSLRKSGNEPHIAASLAKSFVYSGDETCATDGLCATSCPVNIDTGKLIKNLRSENVASGQKAAKWIASHMKPCYIICREYRFQLVGFFHALLGTSIMRTVSSGLRKISGNRIPLWNPYMPQGAGIKHLKSDESQALRRKVVYFPSCINRSMGLSKDQYGERQLSLKMTELLHKGGYEVIFPDNLNNLCCGMAFASKGYTEAGKKKSDELEAALA